MFSAYNRKEELIKEWLYNDKFDCEVLGKHESDEVVCFSELDRQPNHLSQGHRFSVWIIQSVHVNISIDAWLSTEP